MELLIMAYALKTACARNIIGVIPYFPYSKQSKMRKRGSIVCKLLASMLAKAGAHAWAPGPHRHSGPRPCPVLSTPHASGLGPGFSKCPSLMTFKKNVFLLLNLLVWLFFNILFYWTNYPFWFPFAWCWLGISELRCKFLPFFSFSYFRVTLSASAFSALL